jgi:hypothetical protein
MDQNEATHELSELDKRAEELYATKIRPQVETEGNIGKIIIVDVESGDYEIGDETGIESSRRLQARHPGAPLYAFRIGYKTLASFAGGPEPTTS